MPERRPRILVVGRPHPAEGLRPLLEALGNEMTEVPSADDGLRVATEWAPDVVLYYMGRSAQDGCRLARELRRNPTTATALLVALFGYSPAHDARLARDAGFDHLLVLPVSADVLRRTVGWMGYTSD
jgi:CheY-like chemotaxis protein